MPTLIMVLFFAAIPIWMYVKMKLFAKEIAKAPVVSSTVISCEQKVLDEDEPTVYLVTYEFAEPNGTIRTAEEWREKKVKVGKTSEKLLIYNKPSGYTLLDLKEREVNNGKGGGWLLAFSALILVIGAISYVFENCPGIGTLIADCMLPVMGVALTALSIFAFVSAIRKRQFERDEYTRIIQGEIIGYRKKYDGSSKAKYSYFPIYKYYFNGQECEYESQYGGSKKKRKGTRVELYYNGQSGTIAERDAVKKDIAIGVCAALFAAVLWFATYMVWIIG